METMYSIPSKVVVRLLQCSFVLMAISMVAPAARAAISWDGSGNSNWWFDPANWNQDAFGYIPPTQDTAGTPVFIDAQHNLASAPNWDLTGEGIVYDPANDPFFASAAGRVFPTGSPLTAVPTVMRDYGPQTIYRLYVSRNTVNTNVITIKNGDLVVESTIIIGRSGSTGTGVGQQNLGRVNQLGGSFRMPVINLDVGQRETSGWGNGTYDYRAGTFEVGLQSVYQGANLALRLSHGGTTQGAGGVGRLIVRNPASGGHIRTWDMSIASFAGVDEGATGPTDSVFNPALDPDGTVTGVGIVEFHYANGGTRPIQVVRNLSINNGTDPNTLGVRSARLDLQLDSAVTFKSGTIPVDLALIDVDFDDLDINTTDDNVAGIINGTGSIGQFLSKIDASANYTAGSIVSATFGNTIYNWTISYQGSITYANTADANNSVVASISATGGNDIVLIGASSQTVVVDDPDFDGNGRVDGTDFLIWQRANGGPGTPTTGDANGDTVVNAVDYGIWKNQFGNPFPSAPVLSGVPEPGSLALAGMIAAALLKTRRRPA